MGKWILKVMGMPVHALVNVAHRVWPHEKRKSKAVTGCALMLLGAYLATEVKCPGACPHFIWDTGAWFLHGFGAAPIIGAITGE